MQNSSQAKDHKIGLISDTHNRWLPRVAEIFADVDEIWHLGDVCEESLLDELRAINSNLVVVLGNNDFNLSYPETQKLKRGKEIFYLVHILPRHLPRQVDWILFGHTHRPHDEVVNKVHLFNPGSAGRGRGSAVSVGLLTSRRGEKYQAELVPL